MPDEADGRDRDPEHRTSGDDLRELRLHRPAAEAGHEVVAAVGDGPAYVAAVLDLRPDASVVDVRIPPSHTDEGLSNASIAEALVVTLGAVEKHTQRIFAKVGLRPDDGQHRRVLAVVRFLQCG